MKVSVSEKNKLKVGDYCRAYVKGIHQITKMEWGSPGASTCLVTMISVLDSNMNPARRKVHTCDIYWVTKVDPVKFLEEVKASHQSQLANIMAYLMPIHNRSDPLGGSQ